MPRILGHLFLFFRLRCELPEDEGHDLLGRDLQSEGKFLIEHRRCAERGALFAMCRAAALIAEDRADEA